MGPMTGRGAGFCTGYAGQGWAYRGAGGGMRMGLGRGRCQGRPWDWADGRRREMSNVAYGYPAPCGPLDPELEKQALAEQARALEMQLDTIQKRLAKFESEPASE